MPDIFLRCATSQQSFIITEWEQNLLARMELPLPTLCAAERHRRRLAYRNERKIYRRNCDLSGRSIVSMYSADKPFKVYHPDLWWGDEWDGLEYGREFDFSRPFFEQFSELQREVPRLALVNVSGDNSEYCLNTLNNKNCYLVFGGDNNQDCRYSTLNMYCIDTADVYWVNRSELVYDSLDCDHCYDLKYSQNCSSCRQSAFLYECRRCDNCIGCAGLVDKRYYIFNQPYSEEDYRTKVQALNLDSWSGVQAAAQLFAELMQTFPRRFAHLVQCENVTGDYVSHAKNCSSCFTIEGPAEELKDCICSGWDNSKDLLSSNNVGIRAELYYEMVYSNTGRNCAFSLYAWSTNDSRYCDLVMHSSNLFGCVGLKKQEYCIFNRPYPKSEYTRLRKKIIDHMRETREWGEFFPIQNSPWAYNETGAQDFFPLSKSEALFSGLRWMDEEEQEPGSGPNIADRIGDVTDDVLQSILICEKTGRPYKIIPQELKFYREQAIPIPRYAPDTRHGMRLEKRNGLQVWSRRCDKCAAEIVTTYSPQRPETVYCEHCFRAELY